MKPFSLLSSVVFWFFLLLWSLSFLFELFLTMYCCKISDFLHLFVYHILGFSALLFLLQFFVTFFCFLFPLYLLWIYLVLLCCKLCFRLCAFCFSIDAILCLQSQRFITCRCSLSISSDFLLDSNFSSSLPRLFAGFLFIYSLFMPWTPSLTTCGCEIFFSTFLFSPMTLISSSLQRHILL